MNKRCKIVLLLVLFIMISGCGKDSDSEKTDNYVYNEFDIDFEDKLCMTYYFNDNKLYYITCPDSLGWIEEIDGEWTDDGKLNVYDIETKENKEVCDVENASDISKVMITKDNEIKLIKVLREDIEDAFINVITISETGEEEERICLSDSIKESFNGEEVSIIEYYFINENDIYVICKNQMDKSVIVKADIEGNVIGNKVIYEDIIDRIVPDADGRTAVITKGSDGLAYSYINFETGMPGEVHEILDEEDVYKFGESIHSSHMASKIYTGHDDITFYLRDTQGLCSYNEKKQKITYMFDWLKVGLIGNYVRDIIILDDGKMLIINIDNISKCSFGILEERKEEDTRIKIRCAVLDSQADSQHKVEDNIIKYNRTSKDYYVEFVSYEKSSNPINAFAQDVLSGNMPDIIDVSGVDVQSYVNQGLFEDLTPFMDKDDVLNKDFYIDGLYDAMTIDGKCYFTIKNIYVTTMTARASDTEEYKDGWTIDEMTEYYDSKPSDVYFDTSNCKMVTFNDIVTPFIDNYIDWKTGVVSFDSDDFRKKLEFCNRLSIDDMYFENAENLRELADEGRVLTEKSGFSIGYNDIYYAKSVFRDDVRYIGYPTDGIKAYITPMNETLAMSSASENKEGAWDFMKFLTINQPFQKGYEHNILTSSAELFEKHIKQLSVTEKTTDEDGEMYMPFVGDTASNDFIIPFKPLGEDETSEIRSLFKHSLVSFNNSSLMMIIEPVVDEYFRGKSSVDDVVDRLQDRVGKYVNENR